MKSWQEILLGALLALICTAVIWLIAAPPRGKPVELLPPPTPAPIIVHVSGEVKHPGLYALAQESRVAAAIDAAGGLTQAADEGRINLAEKLHDGDKVLIPAQGEAAAIPSNSVIQNDNSGAARSNVVNINRATRSELEALPGIGPTRAADIIAYREAHGPFRSLEELLKVAGIGKATLEGLREFITLE